MIGKIILGRYRIIRVIGRGGMSCVYLAEHVSLHNLWAIKAAKKDGRGTVALLAEPNLLKKLSHFALPRIVDICEDREYLYIVMDYIEGQSLGQLLEQRGRFGEQQIVQWGRELCDVIGYLHHQHPAIIYRDLKPGNLIVDRNGRLRLIDFGIAIENREGGPAEKNIYLTKGFAAPEQYRPEGQKDIRIDIYALGATLYALGSGMNPGTAAYGRPPLYELNRDISDGLDMIIRICMDPNPKNRFQNTDQLLYALNHMNRYNAEYRRARQRYQIGILAGGAGILVSLSLIFGGIAVRGQERYRAYARLVSAGTEAALQGEYEEARQQFEQAVRLQPESLDAYLGTAKTYMSQYQYGECLDYMNHTVLEALPEAASDGRVSYLLGQVYDEMGELDQAAYFYGMAAGKQPEEPDYMRDYICALLEAGELQEAEEQLAGWEAGAGNEGMKRYLDAWAAKVAGDFREAEEAAAECIQESGDDTLKKQAFLLLAGLYKERAQAEAGTGSTADWYGKEIQVLSRADRELSGGPYVEILEAKGEALYQRGRQNQSEEDFNQAADTFRQLIEFGYTRSYLYRNIAIIYQVQRKWEQAEAVLKEMEERYPDDWSAWHQQTLLYLEMEAEKPEDQRDYGRVKESYEKALALSKGTADAQKMEPLTRQIEELTKKGWISWDGS
ncbi:MAG: protein kinase [Lachnospiraceae bacterium]|nr:protein kinase [Lachnospiraceae bacterium]